MEIRARRVASCERRQPVAEPGSAGRERRAAGGASVTFEDAQKELEQIVERLERGQTGLDEAIKLWERGEELYRFCVAQLDAAHGRVEELAQRVREATH